MDQVDTGVPELFVVVFVLAVVVIVVIALVTVVGALRSRRVLRDAGLDPLAAGAQIAARFANGPLGSQAPSLEHRLRELDDLHARGVISDEEHATARAAVLRER